MTLAVWGNIVCFIGSLIMILGGFIKTKKNILLGQCLQHSLQTAGNLMLGGITGGVSNGVSLVRNLVCLYLPYTTPVKLAFIAIQVAITAAVNSAGLIGWLPVLAAILFTWILDTKNPIVIKSVCILAQLMWLIYDFSIHNYLTILCDVGCIAANIVGICRIRRAASENEEKEK